MLAKIGIGLGVLSLGVGAYVISAQSDHLQVEVHDRNLLIQGDDGEQVEIKIRQANGQVLSTQNIALRQGQAHIQLPPSSNAYISVSHDRITQNFELRNQQLRTLELSTISDKAGLRDRALALAQKQLQLAPDQYQLLQQCLSLLSQANIESQGKTLAQVKSELSSPLALLEIFKSPSLSYAQISTEISNRQIQLGNYQDAFVQAGLQFHQSLTQKQKDNLLSLKFVGL